MRGITDSRPSEWKRFIRKVRPMVLPAIVGLVSLVVCASAAEKTVVYQANGIKIGEVTQTQAIIWTRLTRNPELRWDGVTWPNVEWKQVRDKGTEGRYRYPAPQIPEGHTLEDMEHIVPGAPGQTRVVYWPEGRQDARRATSWTDGPGTSRSK